MQALNEEIRKLKDFVENNDIATDRPTNQPTNLPTYQPTNQPPDGHEGT